MTTLPEKPPLYLPLILGSLSAIPPMAIDMYLPALPMIASDIGTDEGSIQFSLMMFFAGLMLGQLFYGPLSDRFGRKPLIYFGLVVFAVASFICVFATRAVELNLLRFAQGLGGSIGMVISIAVVRDLYTGLTASRLLSLVVMVLGVAPIVAPLLGSTIISVASWRIIFVLLGLFGVVLLGFVVAILPETRLAELRNVSRPADSLRHYAHLLVNRRFIPFVLALSIAQAGFFAYLSASASVFISVFGMSPLGYSILFAANAIGLMVAARTSPPLLAKFGAYRIVRTALIVYLIAAVALLIFVVTGFASLPYFAGLLFIAVTMLGFVMPLCSLLAMEGFGVIAGTAAALMGAFQFGLGALASGVTAAFPSASALPMVTCIAVCGLVATVIALTAFPDRRPHDHGGLKPSE